VTNKANHHSSLCSFCICRGRTDCREVFHRGEIQREGHLQSKLGAVFTRRRLWRWTNHLLSL